MSAMVQRRTLRKRARDLSPGDGVFVEFGRGGALYVTGYPTRANAVVRSIRPSRKAGSTKYLVEVEVTTIAAIRCSRVAKFWIPGAAGLAFEPATAPVRVAERALAVRPVRSSLRTFGPGGCLQRGRMPRRVSP
jgi:hypothetical protein